MEWFKKKMRVFLFVCLLFPWWIQVINATPMFSFNF